MTLGSLVFANVCCCFCGCFTQLEGDEPYMDGRLGPGDCLGDLSFFFKMRHIYTCKATTTVTTFRVERTSFQTLLEMFLEEADKLARNALAAYKKAWNRAGSAKSGASSGSGKSVQETMDELVDGNLKHTINMLERRQKMREIQEAMKHASRGNIPELRAMFASGVSVNSVNQERRTCLHLAACEGQKDTVTFLLDEMGADLSVVDRHGSTPMNDAGLSG